MEKKMISLRQMLMAGPWVDEAKKDRLVDYSQSDFIAWNREREMHLQTIDHLKSHVAELTAERQKHIEEIAALKQAFVEATCRDGISMPEGWA